MAHLLPCRAESYQQDAGDAGTKSLKKPILQPMWSQASGDARS